MLEIQELVLQQLRLKSLLAAANENILFHKTWVQTIEWLLSEREREREILDGTFPIQSGHHIHLHMYTWGQCKLVNPATGMFWGGGSKLENLELYSA